jgi:hypothetical protein
MQQQQQVTPAAAAAAMVVCAACTVTCDASSVPGGALACQQRAGSSGTALSAWLLWLVSSPPGLFGPAPELWQLVASPLMLP